jgi:hypothetical protein
MIIPNCGVNSKASLYKALAWSLSFPLQFFSLLTLNSDPFVSWGSDETMHRFPFIFATSLDAPPDCGLADKKMLASGLYAYSPNVFSISFVITPFPFLPDPDSELFD